MSEAETFRTQPALRGFAEYLRKPALIAPSGLRARDAWRRLAILTVMQVGVLLAIVLPLIAAWQKTFGLAGPDAFEQVPEGWLLPLTLLIAPVAEELFFRGWLTGRPRALWLFACALAVAGLVYGSTQGLAALAVGAGFLVAVLAAIVGWFVLRKKSEPPRWFARAFPVIFYLVVIGFALPHLSNYASWSLLSLPLVLPQLWIGTVLGYVRMRIGLIGSILLHIASNSAVLLITPLFG